ncbi:T9SS type A sorting domain-containing protein [Chryseobacterium sp. PMSZPI]|uniref:T9SS type A sorting domain-containing protein n=1 Tax=Chryseobacterium sp. PMSZPI TaxID=1033900 RepID=UPI000C31C845|nr:T9SS type A sorting domain-containing protein [Chryseobacterium sp. PMSZPI]PKF75496.1 hypothetical protein CW752_04020 [Chryseobacterium sp. PMSZPI]
MKNLFLGQYAVKKTVLVTLLLLVNVLYQAQLGKTYATSQTNQIYGTCVLCSVQNPQNAVGNNETDYTTFNLPLGLDGARIEQTFTFPLAPAYRKISIGVGTANTPLSANREIYVETFRGNTSNGDRKRVDNTMLKISPSDNRKGTIEFTTNKQFDKVNISIHSGLLGLNLGNEFRVYYIHHLPTQFSTCSNNLPLDPYAYYSFDGDMSDRIRELNIITAGNTFSNQSKCGQAITDTEITLPQIISSHNLIISFWTRFNENTSVLSFTDTNIGLGSLDISPKTIGFRDLPLYGVPTSLTLGEYHHYVIEYNDLGQNKIDISIAIDGTQRISNVIEKSFIYPGPSPIRINIDSSTQVDELLLYDRKLTIDELHELLGLPESYRVPTNFTIPQAPLTNEIFTVSPNPTTGQITLDGDIQFTNSDISITNTFGKEVYRSKFQTKTFELPATLPGGIYILNLKTKDGKVFSNKIILTR